MSNIYKKGFFKKIKSLNEENSSRIINYLLERPKIKKFSINPVTPLMNQKINIESPSENKKDFHKPIKFNENKHSLFLKKINMKENKNKYYIEGVYKLFNDEKAFLENIYRGRRIVVGKSRNKNTINTSIRNHNKHTTKKIKQLNKNVSSNNLTFNKSNTFQINNNTFANDNSLMQSKGRKMIWIGGKKNDNYISDEDLKNIYQECINRENIALKEYADKAKNKSFIQNNNKSPLVKECNNILNLQSLILDKFKLRNMETNKLIDRLLRHTTKKKDNLLMNHINDYRIIKEKKDEEEINNIINNNPNFKINNIKEVEKKIQWLSSLREYEDNKKINTNKKNRCISSNNKDSSTPQKYYYSFNKRDIIFDLTGNLFPIFAQVTPKIYREKEKIRDTLNDLKAQKKNSILSINNNIKMNNLLINNKKTRLNSYKGLNIKGKKLLNFEIELSKELEGKKKKIVQDPYREDELTSKLFAKSYSVNNFFVPKSVKNTIELHYNQE